MKFQFKSLLVLFFFLAGRSNAHEDVKWINILREVLPQGVYKSAGVGECAVEVNHASNRTEVSVTRYLHHGELLHPVKITILSDAKSYFRDSVDAKAAYEKHGKLRFSTWSHRSHSHRRLTIFSNPTNGLVHVSLYSYHFVTGDDGADRFSYVDEDTLACTIRIR